MGTDINQRQLSQLASSIAGLHSGKYSDFSIRCTDGTIIRAHRAVVCPRSRVLAAAIDGKFREAISQEIDMEDDEPSIVGKMVDFLYKLDYDDHHAVATVPKVDSNPNPPVERSPEVILGCGAEPDKEIDDVVKPKTVDPLSLLINAKVYVIADKYEINALKDLAAAKYKHVLLAAWNDSAFTESAQLVYENTLETDRTLRDIIVQGASENVQKLLDRGEFVDLLKIRGDLAVEVLKKVVGSPNSPITREVENNPWDFKAASRKKKGAATFGF